MSAIVFHKLLALLLTVALGWAAGRLRWLGEPREGADPARVLSNAAFYIFVPALLFRTMARLDLSELPWRTLAAFYLPQLALLLAVYLAYRRRVRAQVDAAAPTVKAITVAWGNTIQIGIPLAAALFGETGLGIHLTLVSLHALVLLSVLTPLVEFDLARASAAAHAAPALSRTLALTLRNTVVHPVVLPVIGGMLYRATGWPLPPVVDEVLELLGRAVVPLCLVLIGLSLAYYSVRDAVGQAVVLSVLKLLVLPALVLAVAVWGFDLRGTALSIVVMMAALPCGSNALIFAQRYQTLQGPTTAAIVLSTVAFGFTAPLWLAILGLFGH